MTLIKMAVFRAGRHLGAAIVVFSLLGVMLVGCKDNYGACEKAAADIGTGIASGMKVVDSLRVSGQITVQKETEILGYLKFANDANGAFSVCAQQAHQAGSRSGAYTACAQVFQAALSNPAELALIHVDNPQTQATVQNIVAGISAGVTAVLTALGGA